MAKKPIKTPHIALYIEK